MSGFFLIPKKGTGGGAEAIPLIVTCSDQFAGSTITASDGTSTLAETCPSSSPYEVTFILPNDGSWTISGTASGQTFTTSILIEPYETTLNAIPEGSTVLPTDDIQTWLYCAGIFDKAYTTISQVLSDSSTVTALIASNNAVDYMARSTTWASAVCADSSAMTKIGANDYCSDALLADSTWLDAICDSTYFEYVLNVKVPSMTSNTTPSGTVTRSSMSDSRFDGYLAFDGSDTSYGWLCTANTSTGWVQYEFPSKVKINKVRFLLMSPNQGASIHADTCSITIEGSNDGITFTPLKSLSVAQADKKTVFTASISNNNSYQYIRWNIDGYVYYNNNGSYTGTEAIQYYGRSE